MGPPVVVVQLAYRGTFGIGVPFSRVPPFTLLSDGTLIGANADNGTAVVTTLPLDEVERVRQHVLELGFEKLQSHTDSCQRHGNISECVSDASFVILRVKLPSGVREIQSYAGFSNDPDRQQRIVDYLESYKHPKGTPYHPTTAALHVRIADAKQPGPCPAIDPALLEVDKQTRTMWGMKIDGATLETMLGLAKANRGSFVACAGDTRFELAIAPGIPGVDLSEELEIYNRK